MQRYSGQRVRKDKRRTIWITCLLFNSMATVVCQTKVDLLFKLSYELMNGLCLITLEPLLPKYLCRGYDSGNISLRDFFIQYMGI